jgi:hypothetical protein
MLHKKEHEWFSPTHPPSEGEGKGEGDFTSGEI